MQSIGRLCIVFLWFLVSGGIELPGPTYDYLIDDVRILDGTGTPWFEGDIAIRGDRIVAVARYIDTYRARRVIRARGLYAAPGFIDIHSHARRRLEEHPLMENILRQGVTTVMEGNDGSSPVPLGPYLEMITRLPLGANIGFFVGHGSVRRVVMGYEDRAPTADEMVRMKRLVEQAMQDGAFGLSTGLFYAPGSFATTEEVIELARVAAQYGGIYTTHMRDETRQIMASIEETLRIGREARIPVHITHHKVVGKPNWGRSVETLARIQQARDEEGIDVTLDQYPYTATQTTILALIPNWAEAGGMEALRRRLRDPNLRASIRAEIIDLLENERGGGDPARVQISGCPWNRAYEGKTLADILRERGEAPTVENAADLVIEMVLQGNVRAIYHALHEDDVVRIMQFPWTMHASDGGLARPGWGHPHPRYYGTFPRVIARYVREKGVLRLEEAIRKMTSLPAWRLGLWDRGVLRPGAVADVVVFDYGRMRDRATFENPHQYAEGVVYLWVNGVLTIDRGRLTGQTGGRVLRHRPLRTERLIPDY